MYKRGSFDDRPRVESRNVAGELRKRTMHVPGARSLAYQSKAIRSYGEERMKMRARFETSQEGCTFAIKFAPTGPHGGDQQFCLVTHGSSMQIWEMSGVYTSRRAGETHAAKLVQTERQHTDVVSCVGWMPSSFAETFPSFEYANAQKDSNDGGQVTMPPYFSASFDKTLKMHRAGACVGTITEHDDWVRFMDVDHTGARLLTGSVSSNIFGWDIATLKADWSILPAHQAPPHLSDSLQGINSVNGLEWMHGSTTIFASGAGDGSIKVWDTRLLDKLANRDSCVGGAVAHSGKLNNIQWLKDSRFLMTSGRDDVIRLLDLRMLRDGFGVSSGPSNASWNLNRLVVQEYTGHSCNGYNIQAALYQNDSRICTGSRDGKIYIYDTWSGQIVTELVGVSQPAHLVVPLPERCGPGLISSSAISCHLFVWAPNSTTEHSPENDLMPRDQMDDEARLNRARQEALENTIQQFGDRFLRALRREGPGSREFFDDDVRTAYNQHMRTALRRHGRPDPSSTSPAVTDQPTSPVAAPSSQNYDNDAESSS